MYSTIICTIGTVGILVALLIGLLLGGRESRMRSVMGLGTAQRNLVAARMVAAQNLLTIPMCS